MGDVGRETGIYGRLHDQHLLGALAAQQHGVVSLAQLRALGVSASAVHKRTAAARLHRVHRGVYSLAPSALLSRNGRFMAAVLACGPAAVLSHRSAAALHELRATDRAGIDVTVPGRAGRAHKGIDVHRSKTLTAVDTTTVSGIPCTTVARTQFDLAEVVNQRAVERAFNQAEVMEVLNYDALADQLQRNRHRHAVPLVRAVLAGGETGNAPTESELEERLLPLCLAAGVPAPDRQVYIDPGDGEPAIRVDFAWRAQRLVIETDGGRYHRTRRAFEDDRRRDQRLALAGWRVVRITWRQLTEEPERIVALLVRLLRPA